MATLDDIRQLIKVFGNDILDDERRAHAIICDWHPHETIRFDEVSRLCQQWKKGKRPSVIYIDDDELYPLFEGNASAKAGKKSTKSGNTNTKPRKKNTKSENKNTKSGNTKSATEKKNSIVLSANGNSISIDGNNISVKQTFKSGVSTKTISIHIDTTQSFRAK